MTRLPRTLTVAAFAFALAAGSAGCFRSHRDAGATDPEVIAHHIDKVLDHFDVTDAQRAQLQPVALQVAAELVSMRQRAQLLRDTAIEQWDAATPNTAELHARVDQDVEALRKTLHNLVDQAVIVHDTLTPEQREEIASAAARHRRWRD